MSPNARREIGQRKKIAFWVVDIANFATTYSMVLYGSTHNNYVLEDCCHVLYPHLPRPQSIQFGHQLLAPRATSHMRLRARNHYTSSTLIGGKGRVGSSSLHTMLEGPME